MLGVKENSPLPKVDEISEKGHLNKKDYKWELVWRTIILLFLLHFGAFYGGYLIYTEAKFSTVFYAFLLGLTIALGITTGTHRLWAHRAYKAKLPLRIILCALQTMAAQNSIYDWVRDHRVHHKYTETDADPHNSNRGFFFSHIGWLMLRKHKDVLEKGKSVDLSDLLQDPVVRFQDKYYMPLVLIGFILPSVFCYYILGESIGTSFFIFGLGRFALQYNFTWCVNSAAHLYGSRPYNKNIGPRDSKLVASFTIGEGWHNYHHTFPWDYKTAEFGNRRNLSAQMIDFFASLGWAYDLKTVSRDMIRKRAMRTGDGSWDGGLGDNDERRDVGNKEGVDESDDVRREHLWGFGDPDAKQNDYSCMEVSFKKC